MWPLAPEVHLVQTLILLLLVADIVPYTSSLRPAGDKKYRGPRGSDQRNPAGSLHLPGQPRHTPGAVKLRLPSRQIRGNFRCIRVNLPHTGCIQIQSQFLRNLSVELLEISPVVNVLSTFAVHIPLQEITADQRNGLPLLCRALFREVAVAPMR